MHSLQKLEDLIMNVWSQKEAIDNLRWMLLDSPEGPPSEDDIDNGLLGIQTQLDISCNRLFRAYETVLKEWYHNGTSNDSDDSNE